MPIFIFSSSGGFGLRIMGKALAGGRSSGAGTSSAMGWVKKHANQGGGKKHVALQIEPVPWTEDSDRLFGVDVVRGTLLVEADLHAGHL